MGGTAGGGAAGKGGGSGSGGSTGRAGASGTADGGSEAGLFALASIYGHGTNAVADVDGDKAVELVSVGYLSVLMPGPTAPISVWKGRGDGTFLSTPVTMNYDAQHQSAGFGDVDGDGRADVTLMAIGTGSTSYTYDLGQSDDTFALGPTWLGPTGSASTYRLCAKGAFNGPGSWDLMFTATNPLGQTGYEIDRLDPGNLLAGVSRVAGGNLNLVLSSKGSFGCVGLGDVDGDRNLDIELLVRRQGLTGAATNSLVIAFGNGDGTFRSATTTVPTSFPSTDSISGSLLDIDGDGLADLLVGDSNVANSCQVLWNDGGGTFTPADASVPCNPSYVGDFDGDGINDVLVNGTTSYVLFGDGSRGFGRRLDLPSAAFAVDVNNDGALDLVFTAQQTPGGAPAVTYVYISTALTPAPTAPDIQCDATMLGSLCTAASRI